MLGAVITFLVVCAIVATYMSIVHKFLRAAEEPEDAAREARLRQPTKRNDSRAEHPREPRWAH